MNVSICQLAFGFFMFMLDFDTQALQDLPDATNRVRHCKTGMNACISIYQATVVHK